MDHFLIVLLELLDHEHSYTYSFKLIKVQKNTHVYRDSMYVLPMRRSIYRKM
jgi:hypothetical protein